MHVLLVEDDHTLGHALQEFLASQGYCVDWRDEGQEVAALANAQHYDLIVLDLNLPDSDGLDVLHQLKSAQSTVPVLILTARDALADRVAGLDAGADDYVTKPFELAEFAARVRVFARRRSSSPGGMQVQVGSLVFDPVGRQVLHRGRRLSLSARELAVLELLMARHGQVVTKNQIVAALSDSEGSVSDNAVEVYIYRLRRRLAATGMSIQTVRGFGYLLEAKAT